MKIELYMRVHMEKETPLFVNFSLPNGTSFFRKKALVAWQSFKPRTVTMGITFIEHAEEDRKKIRAFLANKGNQSNANS